MPSKKETFRVKGNLSREELRRQVVEKFLLETPGTGTGFDTSRYTYYVEQLQDGSQIYLTRPAYLKKGFDFLIHVEGRIFLTGQDYPKHEDIFRDLRAKKKAPDLCKRLHKAITEVYNCREPDEILKDYSDVSFMSGFSVELILKVLKWFFIEQDIRDWNYSGRGMLKSALDEILKE